MAEPYSKEQLEEDIRYLALRLEPKEKERFVVSRKGRPQSQYSIEWEHGEQHVVTGLRAAALALKVKEGTLGVALTRGNGTYARTMYDMDEKRETWVLCRRLGTKDAALQEPCQNPKNATGRENGPNGNRSGAER